MPTPCERLTNIIAAYIPSEVVFRVNKNVSDHSLAFESVIVKERQWTVNEADVDLQLALMPEVQECWDHENGKYYIDATTVKLWLIIKRKIVREYEKTSPRCKATLKKTGKFIREISLEDKPLANFLLQVFVTLRSTSYENKSRIEREALFEQFESLRRTYGKRS